VSVPFQSVFCGATVSSSVDLLDERADDVGTLKFSRVTSARYLESTIRLTLQKGQHADPRSTLPRRKTIHVVLDSDSLAFWLQMTVRRKAAIAEFDPYAFDSIEHGAMGLGHDFSHDVRYRGLSSIRYWPIIASRNHATHLPRRAAAARSSQSTRESRPDDDRAYAPVC